MADTAANIRAALQLGIRIPPPRPQPPGDIHGYLRCLLVGCRPDHSRHRLLHFLVLASDPFAICRGLVGFARRIRDVRLRGRVLLQAVEDIWGFFGCLSLLWLYNLLHSAWMVFFLAGCLWSLANLAGPEIAKRWPPFPLMLICQYVAYKQWGGIGIEICLVAFVGVPLSIFHHWAYAVDVQQLE